MKHTIPNHALLQVFADVWSQYSALLESTDLHNGSVDFCLDVELTLHRLFPSPIIFSSVRSRLLENPSCLPASRAALGESFLLAGLWPSKNYFSHSK